MVRDEVTTMHQPHPRDTNSEPSMVYLSVASFFSIYFYFHYITWNALPDSEKDSSNLENESGEEQRAGVSHLERGPLPSSSPPTQVWPLWQRVGTAPSPQPNATSNQPFPPMIRRHGQALQISCKSWKETFRSPMFLAGALFSLWKASRISSSALRDVNFSSVLCAISYGVSSAQEICACNCSDLFPILFTEMPFVMPPSKFESMTVNKHPRWIAYLAGRKSNLGRQNLENSRLQAASSLRGQTAVMEGSKFEKSAHEKRAHTAGPMRQNLILPERTRAERRPKSGTLV